MYKAYKTQYAEKEGKFIKNKKIVPVLIGAVCALPMVFFIGCLLGSSDAVFGNMSIEFLETFFRIDVWIDNLFGICFWLVVTFFGFYALLLYIAKHKGEVYQVKKIKKRDSLLAVGFLTPLLILYALFSWVQIGALFLGSMRLPEGYTYSEYAREGFFQLLAVSIINLIIVLVGLCYFKPNKVFQAILTFMSLCTFIMIASSAMRMIIYIQYYYLTFLRILVLWSLAVLTLIFVGVIAFIVKKSFPLFRYSLIVFTCFYIALSFSHPDYWIAKINLESTKDTRSEFFQGDAYDDFYFLSELSADSAPVMMEWMEEEGYSTKPYYDMTLTLDEYTKGSYDVKKEWAYMYLRNLSDSCSEKGIREFNVSRFWADYMAGEK